MTSRIEETWRLWSKFLDDYSRFEEWLKVAEITAGNPDSANVLYTSAKEELKKFEVGKMSLLYSSPRWLCVCLEIYGGFRSLINDLVCCVAPQHNTPGAITLASRKNCAVINWPRGAAKGYLRWSDFTFKVFYVRKYVWYNGMECCTSSMQHSILLADQV